MSSSTRNQARVVSITNQLGKVARIHSRNVDTVLWRQSQGEPPGYSGGREIVLNAGELPPPTDPDAIATWVGVLMHEVGHCEWSPETVTGANHRVFNLAEDARQEALLIEHLPGTRPPLTRAVSDLILNQERPATPAQIWPLIAGRRYLPAALWNAVRDGAVAELGETWVDAVATEIDLYMRLIDPGYSQVDTAREILERLEHLFHALSSHPVMVCESSGGDSPRVGAPSPVAPPSPPPSQGDGDESDDESDDEGDAEGGDGDDTDAGTGPGAGKQKADDAIRAAAEDAGQEAAEAMAVTVDVIADHIAADIYGATDMESQEDRLPVTTEARMAAARLIGELKPFLDAAEAGLDRLTGSGRIRPDRMAAGYRPDRVFDKWRIDQDDAVSVDIIVAVDVSGSMSSQVRALSQATWVIQTVAARTAANVTVIAWDHEAAVVNMGLRDDTVPTFAARGGTMGMPMLELAQAIFEQSHTDRRWLIVMTDGDVGDEFAVTRKMDEFRKAQIAVTPLGLGDYADATPFGANAQTISSLAEMPLLIGGMLAQLYHDNVIVH